METSIYEDLRALEKRFMDEFGEKVKIEVKSHGHNGRKNPPAKTAVDIITKGGFEGYHADPRHNGNTCWINIAADDGYGKPEIVLFYWGGKQDA